MKKLYIFSGLVLFVINTNVFAQRWVVRYNGTGNAIDAIKGTVVDNSGNVYITGSSNSGANSDDYITIKYNTNGVQQWIARYNGIGSGSDVPASIFVDAAGNVYVTGYSDVLTGGYVDNDVTTIKYSPTGAQLWASSYHGPQQRADAGAAAKVDASGNVYVTGYTTVRNGAYTKKDYLTIKYNSLGVQQWTATYNGPANQDDAAVGLGLDQTGNVYVTGTSFAGRDPVGEEDYLTIKYNSAGVQQWTARYNGPISEPDRATAIAVDKAGNSYVTGYSRGVDLDIATVKYNTNGTQQWVARYDGPAHSSDIAYAIALDNSGNVYVAGSDQAIIYNTDFCTIKYNSSGVQQWEARYASATKDNDEAYAIAVDAGSNVYVTGYVNGVSPSWDIATIKYNSGGAQQWVEKYDGPGHGNDNGAAVGVDAGGNVYVAGTSLGKTSDLDFVTIKYNSSGLITTARTVAEDQLTTNLTNKMAIYPDPAHNFFKLELPGDNTYDITIIDETGRMVFEEKNMRSQSQINCEKFPNGIYFVKARSVEKLFMGKFIKH
jgi:uncharacterized delta-60 repeat protein